MSSLDELDELETDAVWGAENIGRLIGRSAGQVYYLHSTGKLQGAVRKIGSRTLIGSRRALRNLAANFPDSDPSSP